MRLINTTGDFSVYFSCELQEYFVYKAEKLLRLNVYNFSIAKNYLT
jgi:hypothetical protein